MIKLEQLELANLDWSSGAGDDAQAGDRVIVQPNGHSRGREWNFSCRRITEVHLSHQSFSLRNISPIDVMFTSIIFKKYFVIFHKGVYPYPILPTSGHSKAIVICLCVGLHQHTTSARAPIELAFKLNSINTFNEYKWVLILVALNGQLLV